MHAHGQKGTSPSISWSVWSSSPWWTSLEHPGSLHQQLQLPAQDSQGSRAGHLLSAMQRLSCQGIRAGHLVSACLWTAGHRPNHLLV
ncbi:hypothetical protein WJX77_007916 [Trebouxia sp. C0004]